MRNKFTGNEKGFTLIELLIVMAIIGILAALIMSNFIGIRQRGRDAQRKSNITQIQAALELYRSALSNYPNNLPSPCNSPPGLTDPNDTSIVYMKIIPCDPSGGSYLYQGSSTTYTLVACLENDNDADGQVKPNGFTGGNCPGPKNYFVATNP